MSINFLKGGQIKYNHLKWLGAVIFGLLGSVLTVPQARAELSLAEINSIARQTTVLIAPALTEDLVEELAENRRNPLANFENSDGVWHPGSGVIIGREGYKYYVLTVAHNFKQRDLDREFIYGIRTSDGKVHIVENVNDGRGCPLQAPIFPQSVLVRFGCYSHRLPGGVQGLDLAIVSFESELDYPVASLGDVNKVNLGDTVYISGWPDPEKEKDPETGYCRGKVEPRARRLAWGPVTGKMENISESQNGYVIFYVDLTRPGMSGGPVFDRNGFLVGIHGRGSSAKSRLVQQYCSISQANVSSSFESGDLKQLLQLAEKLKTVSNPSTQLHAQFSSAQNLNYVLGVNNQIKINIPFQSQAYSPTVIDSALAPAVAQSGESGVVDFLAAEDLTKTPSVNYAYDVVENIYNSFSLANLLRDQPSSGCRFLLLGDPCP